MFPSAATTQLDPEVPERRQGKTQFSEALPYKAFELSSVITHTQRVLKAQSIVTKADELEEDGIKGAGVLTRTSMGSFSLSENGRQWAKKAVAH